MAQFLHGAIDSILQQDYRPLEILVVDDGSTDNTASILQPYIANNQIRYTYQPNLGQASARNAGVKLATGDAIFFVDADDLLPEKAVSTLVHALEGLDDSYCLVHGEMEVFDDLTGEVLEVSKFKEIAKTFKRLISERTNLFHVCLIRKKAINAIGMFSEDLRFGYEDYELILKLFKTCKFLSLDQVVYRYRIHNASDSRAYSMERAYLNMRQHRSILKRILKKESLLTKIAAWKKHYFWTGMDFSKYDQKLSREYLLIAWLICPWDIVPLRFLIGGLLKRNRR